ncbi:2'-5' RNA ligase family protein [Planotetraspora sp. A-T 1434]|uniref:2'-5' RNA ligase family protein n=1 Tax=Planotetraspora sp. A-T 1434 TaxID=2979219 RepID=UPI0021BE67BC|nr:2'-5' RNA ligase family protein [Planotetraspora sp. A-T 1434]MCT9933451.1 2'-5' RNA ligase family protein [Planotetraspora sp. A-T 1434]
MTSTPYRTGETALAMPVLAAEPVAGRWRERYDSSAAYGVPAHVTVLYSFLPSDRLDQGTLGELRELFAAQSPFDVRFRRCGRFPFVGHAGRRNPSWRQDDHHRLAGGARACRRAAST